MAEASVWERLDAVLGELERLSVEQAADEAPPELVQRLLGDATRIYAAKREASDEDLPPFPVRDGAPVVTATEAVTAASQALRALNIEVFELAMWQARGPA